MQEWNKNKIKEVKHEINKSEFQTAISNNEKNIGRTKKQQTVTENTKPITKKRIKPNRIIKEPVQRM